MKKNYLLILLAACSLNLFCQQDKFVRDSSYEYRWDVSINDWIYHQRSVSVHDARGNKMEHIQYDWDSVINGWACFQRNTFAYDFNGNQTEEIIYVWNSAINDWVHKFRDVSVYDADGNLTVSSSYIWKSGAWRWGGHTTYEYDSNGNNTESIHSFWDSDSNDLVFQNRWKIDMIQTEIGLKELSINGTRMLIYGLVCGVVYLCMMASGIKRNGLDMIGIL